MRIIPFILDLIYPPKCAFCQRLVENSDNIFCASCRSKLPYASGEGRKLSFVAHNFSSLYYEGNVRASFLRYKFAGVTAYAAVYGEIMSKSIDENKISCDIITWVPLSRRRLRSRGYDQAELIARELAERSCIKCSKLLVKTRHTRAQSKTGSAEKRRTNISGAYRIFNPEETVGKHVLLIDDIVTTGATVSEAAAVLKAAGASEITVLSLARKRD